MNLREQYLETDAFAFDIETDTTHYHWSKSQKRGLAYPAGITHVSFYSDGLEPLVLVAQPEEVQYIYDEFDRATLQFQQFESIQTLWNFTEEDERFIRAMFTRENYTAIAHNLVFDARQIFGKFGITPPDSATFWDTQAIHVFGAWGEQFEENDDGDGDTEKVRDSFTLYNLTSHWLSESDSNWWKGFKGERGNLTRLITDEKRREKLGITLEDIERYVAIDSIQAYRLYQWQKNEIEVSGYAAQEDTLQKIKTDSMLDLLAIELDYTKLCISMASTGVRANVPYLHEEMAKYVQLWKENLEVLGLTLEDEHLFRSPSWQKEYIFSRVTPPDDEATQRDNKLLTKTGNWSFCKEALIFYAESYPDLIYFRYHGDLETKIEQIENFLRHSEYDGRIHFLLSRLTVTGRNAGSSPNTQNLRMKDKPPFYPEGAPVQKPDVDAGYLIADEGKQLISLDCSNGENWFAAMYARDDAMAMACASKDFHTVMASTAYFANQWDTWDAEQRKGWRAIGKNITFGTAYGMGTGRLARELGFTFEAAKELLDNRDKRFWRIAQAKQRSSAFAKQSGYTVLWTGRRVRIRKYKGQYKGYTAWNSLAQGGLGEMITRGMLQIEEYLKNFSSRIVTQVHDEIVLEIDPNEYREIIVSLIQILSSVLPELWNSRTTPAIRWLFTLDNIENAHKWGYNPFETYRLPLGHYVNRWGFHEYKENQTEADTWINEFGFGELALTKELGKVEDFPEISIGKPFRWVEFRQKLTESLDALSSPISVNGRTFVFPDNITVMRECFHKQGRSEYTELLSKLEEIVNISEEYVKWRNEEN